MKNPFSKIERLKRKAARQYKIATSFLDYMDCGRHMAEIIRPDIGIARIKFNKIMDELSILDPTTPNARL